MRFSAINSRRPALSMLSLWILALIFTFLNAVKPLHIDDTAYHYYARQISSRPLDPYDFEVFWSQYPQPANQVLAPPVLPYWWASAIRLFGDQPFLWKLWLFPFSLLFVFALHSLFRRFAKGLEILLVWMTVLSPTFLPSLNLMLDVPALALGLSALAGFLRACNRQSLPLALLAGLLAGLGMQTKYTAFLSPVVMLLYALLFRRLRLGLAAVFLAVLVFTAWECFLILSQGKSHFLTHLPVGGGSGMGILNLLRDKRRLLLPLLPIVGAVASYLALLGMAALRMRRRKILWAGVAIVGGYAVLTAIPERNTTLIPGPASEQLHLTVSHLVLGSFGLMVLAAAVTVAGRLLTRREIGRGSAFPFSLAASRSRRIEWFLVIWLGLELAGYFALSPFLAVRRVLGLVIVLTILVGRLASYSCRTDSDRSVLRIIAVFAALLGLVFQAVDLREASAQKQAAELAATWVRQRDPQATIWYVGHWGFQFYAERAGMKPVVPKSDDGPQPSVLRPGDWLVVPDPRIHQQPVVLDLARLEPADVLVSDPWPLRTIISFYGGKRPDGPRITVTIYRVGREWTPHRPGSAFDASGPM